MDLFKNRDDNSLKLLVLYMLWVPKAGRTGTEAQGGNNESSGLFWHNYSIDGRKGRARIVTTCRSKVGFRRGG